jgi:hypothetical protein
MLSIGKARMKRYLPKKIRNQKLFFNFVPFTFLKFEIADTHFSPKKPTRTASGTFRLTRIEAKVVTFAVLCMCHNTFSVPKISTICSYFSFFILLSICRGNERSNQSSSYCVIPRLYSRI